MVGGGSGCGDGGNGCGDGGGVSTGSAEKLPVFKGGFIEMLSKIFTRPEAGILQFLTKDFPVC